MCENIIEIKGKKRENRKFRSKRLSFGERKEEWYFGVAFMVKRSREPEVGSCLSC